MLFLLAFLTATAWASPIVSGYHYSYGDKQVNHRNSSEPIRFKGVPIGTIALDPSAAPGTVQPLTDGHHFFQADWFLTDKNGGSWEFLPGLRNKTIGTNKTGKTNKVILKRQSPSVTVQFAQRMPITTRYTSGLYIADIASMPESSSTWPAFWTVSDLPDILIDFIADDSLVTTSTALIGDLTSIFFNAMEFFS